MNPAETKRQYFDSLAERWDSFGDVGAARRRLCEVIEEIGPRPQEHLLDLGCGTGLLVEVLLDRLGPDGKIHAADISPEMIRVARGKSADPRVDWVVADAARLPYGSATLDRVFCFSSWPHFSDPAAVARELARVLKPGGRLHILHLIPRARVNEIHTSEGGVIAGDLLIPADELAALLASHGFSLLEAVDSSELYLLTAVRDHLPGGV